MISSCVGVLPKVVVNSVAFCAKSAGGINSPGRLVMGVSPFNTMRCNSVGNPRCGKPKRPAHKSKVDCGNSISSPRVNTSDAFILRLIKYRAKSPTHLELGVTLTTSPNKLFTSRYMSKTSVHLDPNPIDLHCTIKLEYCPPGI